MKNNNKPTRGIPLAVDEKRAGDNLKPHWWGGIRFQAMPSFGSGAKHSGPSGWKAKHERSDWQGGNIQKRR